MGVLPPGSSSGRDIVSITAPESLGAQSYQSLLGAASSMGLERGRCLVVTSAPDRAGKTETVANLAVGARAGAPARHRGRLRSAGAASARVLRRAQRLGPHVGCGRHAAAPTCSGPCPASSTSTSCRPGRRPATPPPCSHRTRCRDVLASLLAGGSVVIIDAPPTLPLTDSSALARTGAVDAFMLVASARPEAAEQVRDALDALEADRRVPDRRRAHHGRGRVLARRERIGPSVAPPAAKRHGFERRGEDRARPARRRARSARRTGRRRGVKDEGTREGPLITFAIPGRRISLREPATTHDRPLAFPTWSRIGTPTRSARR